MSDVQAIVVDNGSGICAKQDLLEMILQELSFHPFLEDQNKNPSW
jgi:hypothetical protein